MSRYRVFPDIGTSRHDIGYQIPDIGTNIGINIGYPDIGMSRIPISGSMSGSISGIPIPTCTEYRYSAQYRVQYRVIPDVGVDPISGIPMSRPATPDIGVNVYSTGHRSGGDSPGLHESHDEIILTVTVGFSMRRSSDPVPSRMLEPLHELEP